MTIAPLPSVGEFPLYNHDVQLDGFPPVVTSTAEAIRKADGVIIVTPEYNHSIPGVLKNAIDWISRLPDQPFGAKPVALESASPSLFGGLGAQLALRRCFVYLDGRLLNKPEVIIPQVNTKIDAGTRRSDRSGELAASSPTSSRLSPPSRAGVEANIPAARRRLPRRARRRHAKAKLVNSLRLPPVPSGATPSSSDVAFRRFTQKVG